MPRALADLSIVELQPELPCISPIGSRHSTGYGMRSMIDKICVCVVLSSFLSCVSAQPHVNTCDRERDQLDGLALSSCSTTDGVLISEYREPVPLSLYATEFDRRRFFVAYSANEEALF